MRPVRYFVAFIVLILAGCSTAPPPPANGQTSRFGDPQKILFWTPAQQLEGYRNIEKIFPTRTVAPSDSPKALTKDDASGAKVAKLTYEVDGKSFDLDGFVAHNHVVGLLVIKDGKVVLERYERGNDDKSRWISFSVTKSIVSMLIGAAIEDGHIGSVDDPVAKYLPDLAGTSYDGVTIENVLQMASGVEWNEDYTDPNSDVGKTARFTAPQHIAYLAAKPRVAEPGTKFNYNTGETHLVGAVLRAAIGGDLSSYLSKKIWKPYGMETEATWPILEKDGAEHGGCCLSATLRDYGRVGLFALEGGPSVLPKGWMEKSTKPSAGYPNYGYLWWLGSGTYSAAGIFGQAIFVSPVDRLVIVTHSMWPKPIGPEFSAHRGGFFGAVAAALRDSEAK